MRKTDLQELQQDYAWRAAQIKGCCAVLEAIAINIGSGNRFAGTRETMLFRNVRKYKYDRQMILNARLDKQREKC